MRRKYGKPGEVEKLIDDFIQFCTDNPDTMPDDFSFCKFAGISITTLERWEGRHEAEDTPTAEHNNAIFEENRRCLKKLYAYRTHWYASKGLENPKTIGLVAFALKQPRNGGWVDKQPENNAIQKIEISINGVKDAFD